MSNLQVAVAPSAELQVAVSSAAPSIIPPKKQEQHVQQVQCLAPYATPPSVRISFLVRGAERVVEMPLPLPPNKFVEGIPLEPAQFMSTWQRVGADGGLQSQTVVSPEGGIVLETLDEKLTALMGHHINLMSSGARCLLSVPVVVVVLVAGMIRGIPDSAKITDSFQLNQGSVDSSATEHLSDFREGRGCKG